MTSREFELLSIPVIHENTAAIVDAQLGPQGFVSLKPLQWVRSNDKPIRLCCTNPNVIDFKEDFVLKF